MSGKYTLDRRRFLQLAGAATGVAAFGSTLSACGPNGSDGADASRLRINSFGGAFEDAIRKHVVAGFEKEKDVSVAITTSLGAATATQLSAAAKGTSPYDLVYMDPVPVAQSAAAGKLAKLDIDRLSVKDELLPLAIGEAGYSVAYLVAGVGLAYNSEQLDNAPTSWEDLWSSEYKGKVIISDVAGTAGYLFLLEAAKLNGGDENNIEPGFEALKELKGNLASIYTTPDQAIQLLTSGEAWIGVGYSDRTGAAKATGAPLGFSFPEEGALGVLSSLAIPADSGNVDSAYEYMDYQLSADVQKAFLTAIPEGSVNSKVSFDDAFAEENYIPQGATFDNLLTFDYPVIAEKLPEWTTRWAEEIAN
ncbi:ABC transporter substrate-binding protein [Nocardioides sp. GXZ039]|uniref:ABC transporter substrate-binding protein n=1 Tax=Nocardioides sp. GXZ039 TaxID=3136018 RepID=UPI0030F46ED7